ncbi:MAG: hypothetical protein ABI418_01560, partial [Jatrophihabitantaceae bacterium]
MGHNPGHSHRTIRPLDYLRGSKPGTGITRATHAKCPGHAAYIITSWNGVREEYVCTDYAKHGHTDRYTSRPAPSQPTDEASVEAARKQRRTVIDNNKSWFSAEKVRRAWLATFLTRKSPPKGSAAFLAGELITGSHQLRSAMEHGRASMLHQLLGVTDRDQADQLVTTATEARAQVLSLAVVLAAYEASTSKDTWRNGNETMGRYFAFLAANGYPLAEVEKLCLPKPSTKAPGPQGCR